ncbi:MAG TPA: DUF1003 domain-containing protein, partial [Vicinamibacteria bacterium]
MCCFSTTEARRSLDTLSEFETKIRRDRSHGERIAGFAINKAGSGTFVGLHAIGFAAWIVTNLGVIKGVEPFDPFPFGLLTVIVSLEAIFLALLMLIAQNRMTKEADKRALLDLQINLLAEQEGTMTLAMLQRIGTHLGLEVENDEEAKQLARKTNVRALADELEK